MVLKVPSNLDHSVILLERQVFLCLRWATARTSSHQNNRPAPNFQRDLPNRCKGTNGCRETGSLKSTSEPRTCSSIPEPKPYPEPPQYNWTDTKSTKHKPANTRVKTTYLCHHPARSCQCCSTCCCCYSRSSHLRRTARHSQLG